MNRVVILGCGYIGIAAGARLVNAGYAVVGVTKSGARDRALRAVGIVPVTADVDDRQAMQRLLDGAQVAILSVAAGRAGDYRQTYAHGARAVADAVSASDVRHVLYTSSTHVYAQDDGSWVDESSPTQPTDDNGQALVEAEQSILALSKPGPGQSGTAAAVLRLGGIFGPGRELIERIRYASGTQRSDGEAYVNLVHVYDVAAAIETVVGGAYGGVLNIVGNHPMKRRMIYDGVLTKLGLPPIDWVTGASSDARLGKRVRNNKAKSLLALPFSESSTYTMRP